MNDDWHVWRCKRCGFNNGPNSYCRGCGYARNPGRGRRNAMIMFALAASVLIVGIGILLGVDEGPGKRFPVTQVGMGSLFVVMCPGFLVAAIRMWSVATKIPRKRRKRGEPEAE